MEIIRRSISFGFAVVINGCIIPQNKSPIEKYTLRITSINTKCRAFYLPMT